MIFQLILLLTILMIIYLISKNLIKNFYFFILNTIKNRKMAIWVLAILFLPGTVVHEVSHLIMALFLRVPTGPISIFPSFDKEEIEKNEQFRVRTGHIMVAKTDPIRLTLIGVAPMVVGLLIIYFAGITITDSFTSEVSLRNTIRGEIMQPNTTRGFLSLGVLIYSLFVISTSMFASRQDLKSLVITMPVAILILAALYFTGVKIVFEENLLAYINKIVTNLNKSLILAAGVDYFVLIILTSLGWLGRRRS